MLQSAGQIYHGRLLQTAACGAVSPPFSAPARVLRTWTSTNLVTELCLQADHHVRVTQRMLVVDGQALRIAPVQSKRAPSLLSQLATSTALRQASQTFATSSDSDGASQRFKCVCVLQGEFAEVDLTQVSVDLTQERCLYFHLLSPPQHHARYLNVPASESVGVPASCYAGTGDSCKHRRNHMLHCCSGCAAAVGETTACTAEAQCPDQ